MKFGTNLAQPSRQRHAPHEEIAIARGLFGGRFGERGQVKNGKDESN